MRWSRYGYGCALQKRGFEQVGSGLYSKVYAKPDSDRVVKVSTDMAWVAYTLWAHKTPFRRRFVPRLYSLKFHADGFYVAVVERVNMSGKHERDLDAVYAMRRGWGDNLIPRLAYLERCYPGLLMFWQSMTARFGHGNDLHDGNWGHAVSDGRLLIFDPIADGTLTSEKKRVRTDRNGTLRLAA